MTLFRVVFDNADWEATNDNDDPGGDGLDLLRTIANRQVRAPRRATHRPQLDAGGDERAGAVRPSDDRTGHARRRADPLDVDDADRQARGAAGGRYHFELYYTSPTVNLVHGGTFAVTGGVVTATIPANCVFTLVGRPASSGAEPPQHLRVAP